MSDFQAQEKSKTFNLFLEHSILQHETRISHKSSSGKKSASASSLYKLCIIGANFMFSQNACLYLFFVFKCGIYCLDFFCNLVVL